MSAQIVVAPGQIAPAQPNEVEIRAKLAEIGIGAGKAFSFKELSLAQKAEILLGMAAGQRKVKAFAKNIGKGINGWRVGSAFGDSAFFNGDWLLRAAAAQLGIYGNDALEAVYPATHVDVDGNKLDGAKNNYTLTFAAGQTLVILRRDVVAIVLPPDSPIDGVSKLTGKTIAIAAGPLQESNSRVFDLILSYFNVDPGSVKRLYLPVAEIGPALERRRAVAALAIGPIGPGETVDIVKAVAQATRGTPTILGLDDNDAISARFPSLESVSIPAGAFRPRPATPDDDVNGVAVSYRFVVPVSMLDIVAGALGRSIVNTKARLMQLTPLASQIEAPDPSQTNTILPVHPGFANYLNNGDESFFDKIQSYIYVIGVPLSLLGSLGALAMGWLGRRSLQDRQDKLLRLLAIADEAAAADQTRLTALESEYSEIVSASVNELLDGSLGAEHGSPAMLAVHHAREALDRRREAFAGAS